MTAVDGDRPIAELTRRGVGEDMHAAHLLLLAAGGRLSRLVHALAELEVVTLLADGPLPVAELAGRTGTHEPSLYRLLRCAAGVGILTEIAPGEFGSTELGDGLRPDHPDSVLGLVRYSNLDVVTRPYQDIVQTLRSGAPAFPKLFGVGFYQHLDSDPALRAFFTRFMRHWTDQLVTEELAGFHLERFSRLADLGGGDGEFLARVLARHPDMTGCVMDLSGVVTGADVVFAEHGVGDRASVLSGDLFADPIPNGFDAYLLKAVLHNWSDEDAGRLLRRIRSAIGGSGARLLVIDPVVASADRWDFGKFLDLDMLLIFGGLERTIEEWDRLFRSAGFDLVTRPDRHWSLLECRAV